MSWCDWAFIKIQIRVYCIFYKIIKRKNYQKWFGAPGEALKHFNCCLNL